MNAPRLLLVLTVLCLIPAHAISQERSARTSVSPHPVRQSKGFFDYVLGKINPDGRDYGATVDAVRGGAVRNTLDDLYLWSNLFTLMILAGVSTAMYLQLRASQKKEAICVALITQLYNGRVSDRMEIERRTAHYNQLVEQHNAGIEQSLLAQTRAQAVEESTSTKIKRSAEKLEKRKIGPSPLTAPEQADSEPAPSGRTEPPRTSPPETKEGALLLERRLEAMRNTEQNLRERLNQTTFQLEQERQRNATLKGA
jgi:hypothetical protein